MSQIHVSSTPTAYDANSRAGAAAGPSNLRSLDRIREALETRFCGVAFLVLATMAQLFFLAISFNVIELIDGKVVVLDNSLFRGNIFFSGEISGEIGQNGCDNLGSASRRVGLLSQFPNSLYFDNGNFSSANQQANDLLIKSFKQTRIAAINLTDGDIADLGKSKIVEGQTMFVSASTDMHIVSPYKTVMLVLKNAKNEETELSTFVTGFSESPGSENRPLPPGSLDTTRNRAIHFINSVQKYADNTQLKILLFNADFLALDNVLKHIKIRFDLIVCQSSPFITPNKTVKVHDIPIIYPDRLGKSVARVEVNLRRGRKHFRFEYIKLYPKMPRDSEIENEAIRIIGRS
jgi:hypothetical protein